MKRNSESAENDTAVEIDVGIQIALYEVIILEGDLFELQCDLEQRLIAGIQICKQLVASLADDGRPWIEILVNAVSETHEPEGVVLVLGAFHVFGYVLRIADRLQHVDDGFVGAAVGGTPKSGDTRRHARERICAGAAGEAHRGGAGILLVIGVQDEHQLQRTYGNRVRHVRLGANGEHHLQEIFHVTQGVDGIHVGMADGVLVRIGDDGRHLRDQAHGRKLAVGGVVDVEGIVVEGGECPDDTHQHTHGMRVGTIAVHETPDTLMHHGVTPHQNVEVLPFPGRGQLAAQQQVADLEIAAAFRQLLDGIAAIEKHALLAIDVGNRAAATGGGRETRVVSEVAELLGHAFDVDDRPAMGALEHRCLDAVAGGIVRQGYRAILEHMSFPYTIAGAS